MGTLQEIDMSAAATLIVAWRSGHSARAGVVKSGGDVIEALREHARDSLELLQADHGRPYNPDDEQADDVPYLTLTAKQEEDILDAALLEQLRRGSSLPLITPDDMRKQTLALYALLIGNDPASRAIFVRKRNPVSLVSKSLVAIFDDTLTRVTHPVLAFDSAFDVVLLGDDIWILNQKNFETLFTESEAVLARMSEWAAQLSSVVPMADGGREWLTARLRQNSVMRRKVQSILRCPYLSKLEPGALRTRMTVHGLDPAHLMDKDQLIFNKATERDVLLLLNEDLWTGDFSGTQYAAARKANRAEVTWT